jgi:hypothetical protein
MYHEQPGAGHWWGSECVDWPPIFDLFARHKIPQDEEITHIHFSTANPGISASSHWVTIDEQEHFLAVSSIDISYDSRNSKYSGTTENIGQLSLNLASFQNTRQISLELDGQKVEVKSDNGGKRAWFTKDSGKWMQTERSKLTFKNPKRNGPFKEAFQHRMIFVYATGGTAEENLWSYAKARYDAETWYYRGNGAVEVIPDISFNPTLDPDRGVVLYGNAENNKAWPALLSESPVQVSRSAVKIGDREIKGEGLACLFCRPRSGSDRAMVAVVSGTDLSGFRLTERIPYFMSGVAFPDCTVMGVESLEVGSAGLRAAGFFGNDWSCEHGEFAWKD